MQDEETRGMEIKHTPCDTSMFLNSFLIFIQFKAVLYRHCSFNDTASSQLIVGEAVSVYERNLNRIIFNGHLYRYCISAATISPYSIDGKGRIRQTLWDGYPKAIPIPYTNDTYLRKKQYLCIMNQNSSSNMYKGLASYFLPEGVLDILTLPILQKFRPKTRTCCTRPNCTSILMREIIGLPIWNVLSVMVLEKSRAFYTFLPVTRRPFFMCVAAVGR